MGHIATVLMRYKEGEKPAIELGSDAGTRNFLKRVCQEVGAKVHGENQLPPKKISTDDQKQLESSLIDLDGLENAYKTYSKEEVADLLQDFQLEPLLNLIMEFPEDYKKLPADIEQLALNHFADGVISDLAKIKDAKDLESAAAEIMDFYRDHLSKDQFEKFTSGLGSKITNNPDLKELANLILSLRK